jgi:dihydrofolate reductase
MPKEAAMGKLVVTEFVTLDGVFEDPGGAEGFDLGGWAFRFERGPEGDKFKLEELEAAEAQLLGRVTYEGFAEAWPQRAGTGEFADRMNSMPKYVVSKTLEQASWANSTILRGSLADEIPPLKARTEGDILVAGSGELVRGLLQAGLVDELRLMIFPVILGRGRKLFDDLGTIPLRPIEIGRAGDCTAMVLAADG